MLAACASLLATSCSSRESNIDPNSAAEAPSTADGSVGPADLSGLSSEGADAWLGVLRGCAGWRPALEATSSACEVVGCAGRLGLLAPVPAPRGVFVADAASAGSWFGDEDCLYLNVWAPADVAEAAALPVMGFLHGGGNFAGSASDLVEGIYATEDPALLYDGAALAATTNSIVMTANYRLGALGFLASDALDAEGGGFSGNYALLDQVAVLEWIAANIANFGGDPNRVMLLGQSGGGRDVLLLATSTYTEGLIAAAVIHSAPLGAQPKAPAVEQGKALITEMGCDLDDQACMRAVPPGELVQADAAQPQGLAAGAFRPIVDGRIVTDQPMALLAVGDVAGIPMIVGTNDAEYSHRWTAMTSQAFPASLAATQGDNADRVAAAYPLDAYDTAHEAFSTLMADRNVTCPARRIATVGAGSGYEVYLYRFGQLAPEPGRLADGVYHASELLYLFQRLDGSTITPGPGDTETAELMAAYWASFAASGDPNHVGAPHCAPYQPSDRDYLYFSTGAVASTDLKAAKCDLWDDLQRSL